MLAFNTTQARAVEPLPTSDDTSGMKIIRTRVLPPKQSQQYADQDSKPDATDVHSTPSKYSVRPARVRLGEFSPYPPALGDKEPASIDEAMQGSTMFLPTENSLLGIDTTQPLKEGALGHFEGNFSSGPKKFTDGVAFKIDDAQFRAETFFWDEETGVKLVEGGVEVEKDGALLTADSLRLQQFESDPAAPTQAIVHPVLPYGYSEETGVSLGQGIFEAHAINLTEQDRSFSADHMYYNSVTHTGELHKTHGHSEPFYFSAETIRILGLDKADADDLWITTCDLEDPHYRIRISQAVIEEGRIVGGKNARLQLGNTDTPFFIPRLSGASTRGTGANRIDFDSGSGAEIGSYINLGQWYSATPNIDLGLRTFPTSDEGFGGGIDGEYDFMDNPASPFFRSQGSFQTLYTTKDRGYNQWYHQQGLGLRTELRGQWEQWYDPEFVKDFYNEEYEDRTGPRTFANITHVRPGSFWTATASKSTHDFTDETEKLPETSYHLLERALGNNFYLTMDSVAGSYNSAQTGPHAQRASQSTRLTYDLNVNQGFNIVPFVEGGATYYSDTLGQNDADTRWIGLAGTTVQTRFSRPYRGFGKFSAFKHILVPSVTYMHQDSSGLDESDVPHFDAIDDQPTRERIESKIENIILGRNTTDDQTWRVARLAFYQGYDLSNDAQEATDYEIDLEIRPRPWWGLRAVGESHELNQVAGISGKDLDSLLSYLFYDDGKFENSKNAQLGYTVTRVDGEKINREILYGVGYKFSPQWSVSVAHRYDLDRKELSRQTYEVRRRLHKWNVGVRVRDRELGTDYSIVFGLIDIAGTEIRS